MIFFVIVSVLVMATTQPTIEDGCYYCGQSLRSIIAGIGRHLRDVHSQMILIYWIKRKVVFLNSTML